MMDEFRQSVYKIVSRVKESECKDSDDDDSECFEELKFQPDLTRIIDEELDLNDPLAIEGVVHPELPIILISLSELEEIIGSSTHLETLNIKIGAF
jgi:hypothetical protein